MFLKFVTTITAVFFVIQSYAANYYFSSSVGNDSYSSAQAQNKATPWQTITKLNSFFVSIQPGDSILFKCGDTFTGTINVGKAGIAGKPIIISSFGTGGKPIITGFVPAGAWVSVGGGVFEAPCPAAGLTVNAVTLNGVAQSIGRYPNLSATNAGYLNVDTHILNTTITSSALNTAVNWAGAEVVMRKNHWIVDRGTAVSNTANTVIFTSTSTYQPTNNFGFFIQNHPSTLDQLGEWYFNPVTKKLRMYFGASVPAGTTVQVTGYDNVILDKNKGFVTINGLALKGANTNIIELATAPSVIIQNCDLSVAGINGIKATADLLTIQNNSISYCNNIGLTLALTNGTVSANTVKNSGAVAGMGGIQGGDYSGINISGTNNLLSNNDVENSGYHGVCVTGDNNIVKNNFINYFTMVKDDGGGIYFWGSTDTTKLNTGRQVVGNIILNGVRATPGTTGTFQGSSDGIYMDENSSGVTISGNTVSTTPGGIKLHNTQSIIVTGNTLYNNDAQLISTRDQLAETSKNNTITGNIIFSKYSTQPTLAISSVSNTPQRTGTINNNNYSNLINNVFPFAITTSTYNLSMWQNAYAKDLASTLAIPIPYYTFSQTAKRNKFANGQFNKNVSGVLAFSVNGNFKTLWENKLDGGSLKGYFTFISGATNNGETLQIPIGSVSTAKQYQLKFSLIGTQPNRKMTAYLINSSSPYNIISEKVTTMISTSRTENTFVFNPTANMTNTTLIFAFQDEDMTFWMDNIGLYTTTATVANPDDYLFFAYNNTTKNQTVKFGGAYVDVKNKAYANSTTLAPYASIVLIKNTDTVSTAPPIVYNISDTLRDIAVVNNSTSKTAKINLYPNPATDYVKISFADAGVKDLNIKIMNTNGDTILTQKVQVADSSYQLNFDTKPAPGCYFIQISGSGINQTSKVIII